MADAAESLVARLARLGFSQYEARAYVGLLANGEQTGYGLANVTGVPQPKIYETLHRLADRSAIVQTSGRPARYVAVSADTLLSGLEQEFAERLRLARDEATRLPGVSNARVGLDRQLTSWQQVLTQATNAIKQAKDKVYLSGRSRELKLLGDVVTQAAGRGVTFVIIHFGPLPFAVPRGRAIRHASTEGTLHSSHQAHHLALVADSTRLVWAFARDGVHWRGTAQTDDVLATLAKGYIRHDFMVQRIFADLPEPLADLYGPGLLELANQTSGRGIHLEASAGAQTG